MASPPSLDFDTLIAPIGGDNPAGESLPFEIREKLKEDRKEENPEDFAPDDPMRPEKFKSANWGGIIDLAKETLTKTSKDLLVAAHLTEALTKTHEFGGLRDGLHLLRLLVEQCWDRLNPPIEDNDVEGRLKAFNWLDATDSGARFPHAVGMTPLIKAGKDAQFGAAQWRRAMEGQGPITKEDIEKAIDKTPADQCLTAAEDVAQCLEELNQLTRSLGEKLGGDAPAMSGVRSALEGCSLLARNLAQRKGAAAPPEQAAAGERGEADSAGPAQRGRAIASREEAYEQLRRAAALLKQLEPHSPIPYFVQRAVELGALPFPLMIKQLIRDVNVLAELNRELGLKDEAAPPASS